MHGDNNPTREDLDRIIDELTKANNETKEAMRLLRLAFVADWTPAEYVEYIDAHYSIAKRNRLSRMDPVWGMWSKEMNTILRTKTEVPNHQDEIPTRYKYVFAYWIARSQLLELHHISRLGRMRKKKAQTEQCRKIKDIILNDNMPAQIASMREMARGTLGGMK